MMSSSSVIALAPAHPEAAQNKSTAVDKSHPQVERVADEEIADQRQRGDPETDRDEGISNPQSGDGIDQHEIDRPERRQLPRREMTEHICAKYSECNEQHERRKHPEVEGAYSLASLVEFRDHERARYADDIYRGPGIARAARPQIRSDVTGKSQCAPHDQHQAGKIVDPRLPDAADDGVDIGQCGCGLLAVDTHEFSPVVATSSAMIEAAAGSPTMPMWSMPSMILTGTRSPTISRYLPGSSNSSAPPAKIAMGRRAAARSWRTSREAAKLRSNRFE